MFLSTTPPLPSKPLIPRLSRIRQCQRPSQHSWWKGWLNPIIKPQTLGPWTAIYSGRTDFGKNRCDLELEVVSWSHCSLLRAFVLWYVIKLLENLTFHPYTWTASILSWRVKFQLARSWMQYDAHACSLYVRRFVILPYENILCCRHCRWHSDATIIQGEV